MPVDEHALEADFRARGFTYGVFVDPPGRQWLGFTHPTDEIVVPLQGTVTIVIDGKPRTPAVGEEVFIPAGAVHDVITAPQAGSRWAYGYKRT